MDIFSIGNGISHLLTKENYLKETNKLYPFFQNGSYFAVCPSCGNPILIINLFTEKYEEKITKKRKLHARHYPKTVEGVANYNKENYDSCPLHNPISFSIKKIREDNEENEKLKELILRNEHSIMNDIRKITGIYFTNQKLKEKIITPFIDKKNYCYTYINKFNIPYVALYTEVSISIYGQKLNINSTIGKEIYEAIKTNSDFFMIIENKEEKQIKRKVDSTFSEIFLMLYNHKIRNSNEQAIDIKIFEKKEKEIKTILEKEIKMRSFIYN